MKQLPMPLKPLSIALMSALSLNAQAALYEVIDLGETTEDEVHNYALSGSSNAGQKGVIVGFGSIEDQYDIDHDSISMDEVDENTVVINDASLTDLTITFADDEFNDADLKDFSEYKGTNYAIVNEDLEGWSRLRVWDHIVEDGEYSETTNDYLMQVNDDGVALGFGSAPYQIITWDEEDANGDEFENGAVVRAFASRGFVYRIGEDVDTGLVALESEGDEYGGFSRPTAMNANGLVIGVASTELNEASEDAIEACLDNDDIDYPEIICHQQAAYSTASVVWRIDSEFDTAEMETVGMLFEPSDIYPESNIQVTLNAVNDNGYIVGNTLGYIDLDTPNEFQTRTYAAVYTEYSNQGDRGVLDITDRDKYVTSTAVDINNDNVVIGIGQRLVNGAYRTKAYYYDASEDFSEMVELPSAFDSSSMTVKDINNSGQIVGEFEWEARPSGVQRRRHAYLYEIGDDDYLDLNNAIGCNSQWEIIEVNEIQDDGLILATALGETQILDDEGEPIFGSDGFAITQLVARGVALRAIEGGEVEQCENADEPLPHHERQGAGFGWLSLTLPLLALLRRRSAKK